MEQKQDIQPYPWLLYFNKRKQSSFCSILDPTKIYSRTVKELCETELWTIQHGWCLLAKDIGQNVRELFLWNPSNLKKINLPRLRYNDQIRDCIFSCSPTAADQVCSIVLFPYRSVNRDDSNILFYCQLGDKQWTEVDYSGDLASAVETYEMHEDNIHNPNEIFLYNPVYCNGCLYAQAGYPPRLLAVIEKLEPHGLVINSADAYLPNPFPDTFECTDRLIESNNELFHIQISHERDSIFGIAVHRLDFSQMEWERVKSIKDRVFFLSDEDLAFACQAINPTEGGLIYFTSRENKIVHKYNIEENTITICEAFSNFLPQKRYCSLWFKSDLRRTLALKEERGKIQIRGDKSSVAKRGKTQTRARKSSAAIYSIETGDEATNSCAFPFEIIEVVAEYLNALDYLHFRATNRFFRQRASSLQWRSRLDDLSLSPLLVFFEEEKVLSFVHPKHGIKYKYNINLPQDIHGACEICYSKDGWLLLAVNKFSSIFFNPFTKEVKRCACELAPAYGLAQYRRRNTQSVGFSHPPTSSECVVVELHNLFGIIKVHTTSFEKEKWNESNFGASDFDLTNISPCFHNGAFYYLSSEGKLGIVKVEGEEDIVWEEHEKPCAPCTHYYKGYLVECKGSLLSVFEGVFGNWVRVFKLDESKMEWNIVESLENNMLFVGNQSISAVANILGMENKIYFPRFYGDNIVFYSLETNRYHTFESSEVVDFHCMREKLNSTWIQPRWR